MKWGDLVRSGLWRWYALGPGEQRVDADGGRRWTLSASGYGDDVSIEVDVAPEETVRSVSARLSRSWVGDRSRPSPFAVDFIATLLRSLEPHDPFVQDVVACLHSQVGLGGTEATTADIRTEVVLGDVADALLGRSGGRVVRLLDGRSLRTSRDGGAVEIAWSSPCRDTPVRSKGA
jgi:hypothetical protein